MDRRSVQILSYYFSPTPSVGGVRVGGLFKYLPDFGWEPTVVTPHNPDRSESWRRIVETKDSDAAASLKRLLGLRPDAALKDAVSGTKSPLSERPMRARLVELAKALTIFPDSNRGWISIAHEAALRAFGDRPFDAILTTSPPPSVHVAGSRLAASTRIPWIADLRDLWSGDRNSHAPGWRRSADRWLERRTLRSASALATVSEPFADALRLLHPNQPVHSILNGFDPEEVGLVDRLTSDFTLTNTGSFYQGRLDPTPLFKAVARLIGAGGLPRDRIRLRFFARHEPWLEALVTRFQLDDVVDVLPWVPREDALRAQQESQVLLQFHWGGPSEAGIYSGKIFEYLAARRPIVMIGGGAGVLHDLIEETGAGIHVTNQASLEGVILDLWREFEANGSVAWRGREDLLDRYSHRRMARQFAELLDEVCGG